MSFRFVFPIGASFAALSIVSSSALGSGFAIQEQSVSGLGSAYAGEAARAEDASTVYFNPAGMSLIEKPQLHTGMHFIFPEAKFTNLGSTTLGEPTQGSESTSREDAIVPNLYYVAPLSDNLVWGIGISAPFGLTTSYDDNWVGRYVAQRTELKTVLLNPSLAYRLNDKLSIGGGFSYVKADAVLSNAIDMGLVFLNRFQSGGIPANAQTIPLATDINANVGGSKYDGGIRLDGDGDGWGFNLGAIYEINDEWRWGVHYRSEVNLKLNGQADFEVGALDSLLGAAFQDQGGHVKIDLPDTLSVSLFGQVSEKLAVMADFTRTGWSSFQYLTITFDNASPPANVIPELWHDVDKYSLGVSYKFNDRFTGRFGLAYDESPVPSDEYRSPRIPDEDRTWVSCGVSMAATETIDLHLAYVAILVDDPMIDNVSHSAGQRLYGKLDASVSLLSLGLSKRF